MAARIRFPPARVALVLVAVAAVATISPAKPATAVPVPGPPAVPPAALLPAEAIPGPPAPREVFDVATALSTQDRRDDTGCSAVVHGRLLGPGAVAGQGFQTAVPGGQVSELVARTPHLPDLAEWAAQARRCARVTLDDGDVPTVSTTTVGTAPAVPGARSVSYQQILTLPGQPAELPGLRLRTVAIAAGGALVLLRDAGTTGLDLDALAVAAWQHAAPRLGR
ncbi:hypothetical protein [Amycolatopsis rifamycinica]|uniref:PknH-like extracellular domain-containing protein n=1 Tax=Amycolatopsis rifamycinica TaxID=287986 RepID=A0A066TZR7_9PSEU|nr:hypothetical protein [Amycolatopsis rifamycinica]KDN17364.1 hypothetical protein DV20_35890 [Amycolatopsis rifamycinica]